MFEFDTAKSEANKAKHGINFEEAQALWNDKFLLHIPARVSSEDRYGVVALLGEKHWCAFCTRRNEAIRIISVRRARHEEIERYEQAGNHQR